MQALLTAYTNLILTFFHANKTLFETRHKCGHIPNSGLKLAHLSQWWMRSGTAYGYVMEFWVEASGKGFSFLKNKKLDETIFLSFWMWYLVMMPRPATDILWREVVWEKRQYTKNCREENWTRKNLVFHGIIEPLATSRASIPLDLMYEVINILMT